MDFKVFLSDDALSDLERIVAYIAPHNPVAAGQMGNQLLDAARLSAPSPNAAAWCRNFDGRRCVK
jgi:plasmid stabilization system protein ParE